MADEECTPLLATTYPTDRNPPHEPPDQQRELQHSSCRSTILKVGQAWDPWANLKDVLWRRGGAGGDRLAALDGIRALAFLWVTNSHLGDGIYRVVDSLIADGDKSASTDLQSQCTYLGVMCNGEYGVTVFYVLSGFLIPYILMSIYRRHSRNSAQTGTPVSFWAVALEFWWRRFLRVVPSLWASVGLAMLYGYTSSDSLTYAELYVKCTRAWWTNLVFLTNFSLFLFPDGASCFHPLWSVSVEMQFYLVSPLIVLAYVCHPRYGYAAALLVLVGCVGCRLGVSNYLYSYEGVTDLGDAALAKYLYLTPWGRVGEYAAGILLFMAHDYRLAQTASQAEGGRVLDERLVGMTILPEWLLDGTWLHCLVHGYGTYPAKPTHHDTTRGIQGWPLEWELLRSVLFAVTVVVGGYFTVFASGSLWPSSLNDDEALNLCLLYPLEYPAVACLTALVAWWGMTNAWGPWTAFLSHPLMYVLASLSYTGYLVQYELAYLVTAVLPSSWSTTVTLPNYTAMYLLLMAINLVVALVFSLLIERPFMKLR